MITDLVLALSRIDPPNEPAITRALGSPLQLVEEYPSFIQYRAVLQDGPFREAEVRIHIDEARGLVSLLPREDAVIHEDDIDLGVLGDMVEMDVNPRIPPEGTVVYSYRPGPAAVHFQFTASSKTLYSVSVVWEKKEAA